MSTFGRILEARKVLRVPGAAGDDVSHAEALLHNRDMLPVPPEGRTWRYYNYVTYWISDGLNLNTFMIAGAAISPSTGEGLVWWQGWIAIILGYTVVGILVTISGRMGAVYHTPFPVMARSSFGIFGSFWPVINRVVLAIIWYGVQSAIGGQCIQLLLRCLIPSYNNMKGAIHEENANTAYFVAFFIFSLVSIPAVAARPQSIRHLFTLKSITTPMASIALLIWCVYDNKGVGDMNSSKGITGSKAGWAFMSALISGIANNSSLVLNMTDFCRYASHPRNTVMPQLVTVPLIFSITSLFGIIITYSTRKQFGVTSWNPLDVLTLRLDRAPHDPGTRAGVFFLTLAFSLAQLGANISANSLSAGHDLSALFPRYINVRRGALICAALAFAITPWRLLATSNNFTNYLAAYSMFLSTVSGVIIADYYIVRRGKLNVSALYSFSKKPDAQNDYRYFYGVNWRAYVAYFGGIAILITGFVGAVSNGRIKVSSAAQHIYTLAYPIGFLAAMVIYTALCQFFPVTGGYSVTEKGYYEPKPSWEADPLKSEDAGIITLMKEEQNYHPDLNTQSDEETGSLHDSEKTTTVESMVAKTADPEQSATNTQNLVWDGH